jgi:phthalate 4,5-dioxygenase
MSSTVYGTGTSEYDVLTRTDPRTPGGDLLRRYWQPAALSEELPVGGAPIPVRLMGEDLVLFRDETGKPGLLGLHCSHRGADLSYGRLEDGGLRCLYHGWLFDRAGRCLEQPGEPAGSTFHERIKHPSYPCLERSDVIWTYLGPGEPPEFPNYEFLIVPNEHVFAIKLYHECNWLQGNEGNIDLLHLSFLHHLASRSANGDGHVERISGQGAAPHQEAVEADVMDFGLRVCKIRSLNEQQKQFYLCTFIAPCAYAFPGNVSGDDGFSVNWHVPIDDEHHWKYTFIFSRERALDKDGIRSRRQSMNDGYRSTRNPANRYLQDREEMKISSYSGMGMVFQAHDMCATEGMGHIQDRSHEHLTARDTPMVLARRQLLKAIVDIQEGRDPLGVIRDPARNRFPRLFARNDTTAPIDTDWRAYFRELNAELESGVAVGAS